MSQGDDVDGAAEGAASVSARDSWRGIIGRGFQGEAKGSKVMRLIGRAGSSQR